MMIGFALVLVSFHQGSPALERVEHHTTQMACLQRAVQEKERHMDWFVSCKPIDDADWKAR